MNVSTTSNAVEAPSGALHASAKQSRSWRWSAVDGLLSAPLRCKREQWYLARATLRQRADAAHGSSVDVRVAFLDDQDQVVAERVVDFVQARVGDGANQSQLLAWLQSPSEARKLQVRVPQLDADGVSPLEHLEFHAVAERDPKCHPLANLPRWSTYTPPLKPKAVLLPESLAALEPLLHDVAAQIIATPRGKSALFELSKGKALLIDPSWVRALKITLSDLEKLAAGALVVIDLATLVEVAHGEGLELELARHAAPHEIFSARCEFADYPTRGFAMQDVFPLATLTPDGGFEQQAIRATKSWRQFTENGHCSALLTNETPWEAKHADVLLAALPTSSGELLATDIPWLAADAEQQLAPDLVQHLTRMILGAPIHDARQYWNRWDDTAIIVRDIADLPWRFPTLNTARWQSQDGLAQLGLRLRPDSGAIRRQLTLRTGRIDFAECHDGLPPEAMTIVMRLLAREWSEQSTWAQRYLNDLEVCWQFSTAAGLRHSVLYDAAVVDGFERTREVMLRQRATAQAPSHASDQSKSVAARASSRQRASGTNEPILLLDVNPGLLGARSFDALATLWDAVRREIER